MSTIRLATSCIIPTKDRCRLVPHAVSSVLAQQVAVDEIIVVDDDSSDETVSVLQRQFPAVRIVSGSGEGPGLARHRGAAIATGDILFFLDSDDRWLPHHVARMLTVFSTGASAAYARTENRNLHDGSSFFLPELNHDHAADCFTSLTRWCFLVPSALAVTREAYFAAGGFGAGSLAEDWQFLLRLVQKTPFSFVDGEPSVIRFLHGDNLCSNCKAAEMQAAMLRIAEEAEGWPVPYHLAAPRFYQLAANAAAKKQDWTSVQTWYLQLKEEGLL